MGTRSSQISSGGYDVQVIGEYSPQLNCGICTLIICDATHGCTDHAFCKVCILKHIECGVRTNGNVICPGGCAKVIDPTKLEQNKFADRMIKTLPTKCSNAECPWQGDLLDLVQVHHTNCGYQTQSCNNEGCNETYLKKDEEQHDKECGFKLIECEHCQNEILRMNKDKHMVDCLNENVECIYHDIGCHKKVCRRDIDLHEQTHQAEHIRLIHLNLISCKKELFTSNKKITDLEQENVASNNKIILLEQENIASNNKMILLEQENKTLIRKLNEVETKSNIEVTNLKQEVKNITREFQESRNGNVNLVEKIESIKISTSNEVADEKEQKQQKKKKEKEKPRYESLGGYGRGGYYGGSCYGNSGYGPKKDKNRGKGYGGNSSRDAYTYSAYKPTNDNAQPSDCPDNSTHYITYKQFKDEQNKDRSSLEEETSKGYVPY